MDRLRNLDILEYVFLAVAVFAYYKGFQSYQAAWPGPTGAWAVLSAFCMVSFVRRFRYVHYLHMSLARLDELSGKAFEQYLEAQFKHMGYRVERTDDSYDYGADLLLKKRGETIVVQAKRYDRNVGLSAVQEALGAVAYYGADRAMVVTNSGFTKSARNLARMNEVELWDRGDLIKRFSISPTEKRVKNKKEFCFRHKERMRK